MGIGSSVELTQPEKEIWVRIALVPGLGPKRFLRLCELFGSVEALLQASSRELSQRGVPLPLAQALSQPDWPQIEKHLQWLEQEKHHLIPIHTSIYPPLLREINSPPLLLWVQGDPEHLQAHQLAIVGSRKPSLQGKASAKSFSRSLAQSGITITSGLALGIDGEAHRGALEVNRPTVAVMGTGLNKIYPSGHRELAEKIADVGALVSEFPLGTAAQPQHFPRRNRIISGLSLGVLVVEANLKSGSLITANYSAQFGREVFAIPGQIDTPHSIGCHKLIKDGAKLVDSLEDIFQELPQFNYNLSDSYKETVQFIPDPALDPDSLRLLDCLSNASASIDDLVEAAGFQPAELLSKLLTLELEGYVEALSNGRFARIPIK